MKKLQGRMLSLLLAGLLLNPGVGYADSQGTRSFDDGGGSFDLPADTESYPDNTAPAGWDDAVFTPGESTLTFARGVAGKDAEDRSAKLTAQGSSCSLSGTFESLHSSGRYFVAEAEIYLEEGAQADRVIYLQSTQWYYSNMQIVIQGEKKNEIALRYRIGSEWPPEIETGFRCAAGSWYHFAVVMERGTNRVQLFVDGKQICDTAMEGRENNNDLYMIRFTNNISSAGESSMYLDDVRVYGCDAFDFSNKEFRIVPQTGGVSVTNGTINLLQTMTRSKLLEILSFETGEFLGISSGTAEVPEDAVLPRDAVLYGKSADGTVPKRYPVCLLTPEITRDGAALTDLSPGVIDIALPLANHTDKPFRAVLTAALYEEGRLTASVVSGQAQLSPDTQAETLTCSLTLPKPEKKDAVRTLKVFLFDSMQTLTPLMDSFVYEAVSPPVSHPFQQADGAKHIYSLMATWSENGIFFESDEISRQDADNNLLLTDEEAVQSVVGQMQAAQASDVRFTDLENTIARLAKTYTVAQEEKYAERAALLLRTMAQNYNNIPFGVSDSFFFYSGVIPIKCVYAYDVLYHALAMQPYKAEIEEFLRQTVVRFTELYHTLDAEATSKGEYFKIGNIFPYGLRHAIGTCVILNEPDLLRGILEICDRFFTGEYFYADGMWNERAGTYHGQVVWNSTEALDILQYYYSDPPGYRDDRLGLVLDKTDLTAERYPLLLGNSALTGSLNYPDGRAILYGDTDFYTDKTVSEPIQTQYLKNIEFYDGRYFALTRGNAEDATMVTLDFSPVNQFTGGGHIHGNSLGISLWGSGMEVFPDAGYPRGRTSNGFFHTSLGAHNAPYAQDQTINQKPAQEYTRSALLAYDPGTANGKTIQLIEASSPGEETLKIETSRRLLMLIAIDDARSYVVDLTRLKGGHSHEISYRAVEEEDTDMTVSGIELDKTWENGILADYDESARGFHGLTSDTWLYRQLQIGSAASAFSFTWSGQESGTSVRSYIKGNTNTEAVFARIPTLRRTENNADLQDSFPGWAFRLRRSVTPEDTTAFAAVHETWRETEEPKITNVTYTTPESGNEMVQCITVETDAFTDTIYLSDDVVPRTIDGSVFAGTAAVLRRDSTGAPVWGYVYGTGSIDADGYSLQGAPDAESALLAIEGNTVTTEENLPSFEDTEDMWAYFFFGDGSGTALPVAEVSGKQIRLKANPSFAQEDGGVRMKNSPFVNNSVISDFIEGSVQVVLQKSVFENAQKN